MSFSMMLSQMSEGMLNTLGVFIHTLLFSMPFGFVVAFGRMSKCRPVSGFTRIFISIMRGTPLMLQLMVVYFFPYYLFGLSIGAWRFPAIILGFSINYAAYFAEIYRSGIEAIPKGQYEAAAILGYNKVQTFLKIILPQVIKMVITLVKDTSLAYSLSYMEMFSIAKQIAARETTLMPFAISAVFYYIFNLLVTFVMEKLEKKMNYYK